MSALAVRFEDVYVSPKAYLAAEEHREVRHEYFAGMVRPMPGSTFAHNRIVQNLSRHLGNLLNNQPCEVVTQDIKVAVRSSNEQHYYYPDVIVDCSNVEGSSRFAPEPRVIFEVLSESTETVDRGEKRISYCSLPSLQTYVLVWQTEPALIVYRRDGAEWRLEFLGELDAVLELPEIGCVLPLRDIYQRVLVVT